MENFAFRFDYRVGVADINYGGHVSNAAVLNIFQDARIAYLAAVGPYSELNVGGCGLIMPEAHAYFRREMFLGDRLTVGVRVERLTRSGLLMCYRIARGDEITAEGETPLICFDYERRKPCRMPAGFRDKLEEFEKI